VIVARLRAAATFLGKVWRLVWPYFRSEDRTRAWLLLGTIVALTLGLVFLLVLLNEWNRAFFNAIQDKDFASFGPLLLQFCALAVIYIVGAVYKVYFTQMLEIRWRQWLTGRFLGAWLSGQVFYRLELADRHTDNPDQRIAEDLRLFTSGTLDLALGLLGSLTTLVSFVGILWVISGPVSFALGGVDVTIPGYMVWVAIAYALVGSLATHLVGRPLIGLSFQQQRLEADFRFNLVRVRENAEGIALYHGELPERTGLLGRFQAIRANWYQLMRFTKRLTFLTVGYGQVADIFPILVAAPRYFQGAITLGVLTQIGNAFGQVQGSLSWFIESYRDIASWRATVDRLLTFEAALQQAALADRLPRHVAVVENGTAGVRTSHLDLALPDGRPVVKDVTFAIEPGDRVLVTGPSGVGKSTLFRAIAGIWPFGEGEIQVPAQGRKLFLPQRTYMPVASLRDAVSYPAPPGSFDDATIKEALVAVGLENFLGRLDEVQNWSLQLSGGEQQRLALARALLIKPDWLFLDEATSALDEGAEDRLYTLLQERLPDTTIVSIAHRPNLAAYHPKRFALEPNGTAAELVTAQVDGVQATAQRSALSGPRSPVT
jgi:vitamin B12/bleomycin/antimicrobial peptide transport system ATP-binding/permease protein